jgi:hypothetical protein
MHHRNSWVCAIAAMAVACAPIYESRYPYDEGWRRAMVVEVGRGDTIRGYVTRDCRAELRPEVVVNRVFARVTYSITRNKRSMVVIVEEGDAPERGMTVFVNALDCSLALKLDPM